MLTRARAAEAAPVPVRGRARRAWIPVAVVALVAVLVVGVAGAPAQEPDRAARLAARLRCPVCQAESVADSPSETARAIQLQISRFVDEGRSDAWIIDHYVRRYGRWVLLDPPAAGDTLLLWLLPGAVALAALLVAAGRRRTRPPPVTPDPDERARLDALVTALRGDRSP